MFSSFLYAKKSVLRKLLCMMKQFDGFLSETLLNCSQYDTFNADARGLYSGKTCIIELYIRNGEMLFINSKERLIIFLEPATWMDPKKYLCPRLEIYARLHYFKTLSVSYK